jgi:hypothetical protein
MTGNIAWNHEAQNIARCYNSHSFCVRDYE